MPPRGPERQINIVNPDNIVIPDNPRESFTISGATQAKIAELGWQLQDPAVRRALFALPEIQRGLEGARRREQERQLQQQQQQQLPPLPEGQLDRRTVRRASPDVSPAGRPLLRDEIDREEQSGRWSSPHAEGGEQVIGTQVPGARYVIRLSDRSVGVQMQGVSGYRDAQEPLPDVVRAKLRELQGALSGAPPGVERLRPVSAERTASSWMRGQGYEWIMLNDGSKYAVHPDGKVRSWFPHTQRVETVANVASLPAIVRDKLAASTPGRPPESPVPQRPRQPEQPSREPERATQNPARPEVASAPEQERVAPSEVVRRLKALSFVDAQNRPLPFVVAQNFSEHYFQRHGIPDERMGRYLRNMMEASRNLQEGLRQVAVTDPRVSFDGQTFTVESRDGRITADALHTLWQANGRPSVMLTGRLKGREVRINQKTLDRRAPRFRILEYQTDTASVADFIHPDGSLAVRERMERGGGFSSEFYSGEGSGDRLRPQAVKVSGGASPEMPVRSGQDARETHRLDTGIYFVPETGKPIGRFDAARYRTDAEKFRAADEYATHVARTLRTPEAITAFVTSNFSFVGRSNVTEGAIRGKMSAGSGPDAQHPLNTIVLGTGDCEDFALLLQDLCRRAGVQSIVAKTHAVHFSAYYVEEYTGPGGQKSYMLCQMHTVGFERSGPYASPVEALRHTWHGLGNPVDHEVARGALSSQQASDIKLSGGGITLLAKRGRDSTEVRSLSANEDLVKLQGTDWSSFVRRVG